MEKKHIQLLLCLALVVASCFLAVSPESGSVNNNDNVVMSSPCFPLMVAFGDSLSDIGNSRFSSTPVPSIRWPYGETYFHRATGRFCDGRLITDFIPQALGLPLLDPYLDPASSGTNGKVFAVAGATAMDLQWMARKGIHPPTPNSLDVQLQWFRNYKISLCESLYLNTTQCSHHFSHALYFFGEIGGNDLIYALRKGESISQVSSYIPDIVQKINDVLETLVQEGARAVIVEGAPPLGCMVVTIHTWKEKLPQDKLGCITAMNELPQQHNRLLQQVVNSLQVKYPKAKFLYFDFYNAFYDVLEHAESEGIYNTLDACYTGHLDSGHGEEAQTHVGTLCPNPQAYASWDGLHLTEAMYRAITRRFLVREGFQTPFPSFLAPNCIRHLESGKEVEAW